MVTQDKRQLEIAAHRGILRRLFPVTRWEKTPMAAMGHSSLEVRAL